MIGGDHTNLVRWAYLFRFGGGIRQKVRVLWKNDRILGMCEANTSKRVSTEFHPEFHPELK